MNNALSLLSALSEPTRLAAVKILWDGEEHCVCTLMQTLNKSQSCMSRHMAVLKKVGIITDRRDAQWVRYRRHPKLPRNIATLIETVLAVADAPTRKP